MNAGERAPHSTASRTRRAIASFTWRPVLASLLLLAGCAPGGGGASGPAARVDDALIVLLPSEPDQIDPRYVADSYGLKISRLVFASLVTIDPRTLDVVPDLAESVQSTGPTE